MSQEDTVWQNEQKEVIWLELQAWFAGKSVTCQDHWIHKERSRLEETAARVNTFRFRPRPGVTLDTQMSLESTDTSAAHDIYYDAQVRPLL